MKRLIIALMLTTAPAVVLSAEPAAVYDMTQALSNQLATEALSACHSMNRQGVVAVVDRGGNLVTLMRDDNVGPHNTRPPGVKRLRRSQPKPRPGNLPSKHNHHRKAST